MITGNFLADALETMTRGARFEVLTVSGKPYEFGYALGRKCARLAAVYRKDISESIRYYTGKEWTSAVEKAKAYLPYAEEFNPDHIEEIRGYAEGAGLAFEEVFAMCCHELLSPQGFKGCTDVAANGDVTSNGHVLVAHNEDWSSDALKTVVVVHGRPARKPEFICMSYAGLLPSCGMNSAGVSLTGNALDPNDVRVGIPKVFPVRKALEARRIGEALEDAMPEGRASSYNNIVCDSNGEMYSLEGSATDCAWIYAANGYLVHTNHYTAEFMRKYESSPGSIACSVFRYNRALRLVQDQLGEITLDSLAAVLRDHVNKPCSICRHPDPRKHPLDASETIFSVVFDLTELTAHICKGNPCTGRYEQMRLRAR